MPKNIRTKPSERCKTNAILVAIVSVLRDEASIQGFLSLSIAQAPLIYPLGKRMGETKENDGYWYVQEKTKEARRGQGFTARGKLNTIERRPQGIG